MCGNGTDRLDFTKLYADLQEGIPLVMSLIINRDRDIAKKVCTALQLEAGDSDEVISTGI